MEENAMRPHKLFTLFLALFVVTALAASADAQQKRRFTFGYDQPHSTGYGFSGDVFGKKLEELSKGMFAVDQFPAAQLGQEPVMLQKVRSGDIDFVISSTANGATLTPQMGVMSIHYLFENEVHLAKAIASPELNNAVRQLVRDTVQGAHVITLQTLGLRNLYGKREIKKVEDLKGAKVRVQATKTEDTCFPAYGAQTVHMPFGEVYTSLQTGVVEFAENGVNVYLAGKHYEVAPIMSMTEHEANNSVIWVSEKTWNSFTDEQKKWVEAAANEVAKEEPPYAIKLEKESGEKLQKMGVKLVNADKSGFIKAVKPIQDQLAKELGPHAVKMVEIIRSLK
jgi:TRAP-type transport system periplasmic protein